jgi:porphobilinogen synthase
MSVTLRRLRRDPLIRALTREVDVAPERMIQPLFVAQSASTPQAVPGLTGVNVETPASLLKQVEADIGSGVRAFLLFGVPAHKAADGSGYDFTAQQIEALRKRFGKDIWISADVCVCSFTESGHCGVLTREGDHVDNRASVEALARVALAYAQAGADCVAPSDMMDGRVARIRASLDAAGLEHVILMSYAAKFHSAFYGPFRVAADSAPKSALKDRATYQIDPGRLSDALACAERDAREGADIIMVKPGLPYLDILVRLKASLREPLAVYQVSGEFASIELLAREGLTNRAAAHTELWTAFSRAGAQLIITYGARYAREFLAQVQR